LRHYEVGVITAGLFIALCAALALSGCAKKVVRRGIPFELDVVFQGQTPPSKLSWREKGIRLAKERSFDEAVEAFTQQVLEEPESFGGFNAIAVCYKNLGDHANAMKNFERAVEFADTPEETAKILANIGNLYFAANKPQVALGYYKEAATQFEKNPLYLIFIARTFILLDEYDRARRVLTGAESMQKDLEKYEREDDRGLGSYLMTQCYVALNEEEKVYNHLERALKANPERYVPRLKEDLNDSKSLLFTLKGDPRVENALRTYARRGEVR
jgi:tetratricopeptide (TPR) repeat protein